MPSKVLLCLLAADVGTLTLAARRGLEGLSGSASQVMGNIDALLQQLDKQGGSKRDAVINKIGTLASEVITPGFTDSLNDALNQIIGQIEQDVEPKIQAGFDDTQTAIDNAITELTSATSSAVDHKFTADTADDTWFSCVRVEKTKREEIEAADQALQDSRTATNEPCQLQEDRKPFAWEPSASTSFDFSCDFSISGSCGGNLGAYEADMDALVASLESDLGAASGLYAEAEVACTQAWDVVAEKQSALEGAVGAWNAQKQACLGNHETREVSMCVFGTELQRKCGKVNAYTTLIGEIDAENGGVHSHPDRVKEWTTTATTKCVLTKIVQGNPIDSTTLDTCEASLDYAGDVGTLARRGDDFASLTTPAQFTCEEATITFRGETWNVPTASEPASADYTIEPYHPEVSLAEGSTPFAFCSDGPGK